MLRAGLSLLFQFLTESVIIHSSALVLSVFVVEIIQKSTGGVITDVSVMSLPASYWINMIEVFLGGRPLQRPIYRRKLHSFQPEEFRNCSHPSWDLEFTFHGMARIPGANQGNRHPESKWSQTNGYYQAVKPEFYEMDCHFGPYCCSLVLVFLVPVVKSLCLQNRHKYLDLHFIIVYCLSDRNSNRYLSVAEGGQYESG